MEREFEFHVLVIENGEIVAEEHVPVTVKLKEELYEGHARDIAGAMVHDIMEECHGEDVEYESTLTDVH